MAEKAAPNGPLAIEAPAGSDTRAEIDALRAQLAELQHRMPGYRRMQPVRQNTQRSYEPPEDLRAAAKRVGGVGSEGAGSSRWLDTPQGRAAIHPDYRPIFRPGDIVTINPNAAGWGNPRTWGEILGDTVHGFVGEVVGTMFMTRTWEPKYKVSFAGMTHGSGDGFRESELLPYAG
jgi:hypothetical protein